MEVSSFGRDNRIGRLLCIRKLSKELRRLLHLFVSLLFLFVVRLFVLNCIFYQHASLGEI